ncbi:MAG: hypothetical protein ABEJ57_07395 [Halobacteriaceae archaeon]
MVADRVLATVAAVMVTASLPFYLYGAWLMLDATQPITWETLRFHLIVVLTGLVVNTIPVVFWMVPRLPVQLGGLAVLHAIIGVHAYALLVFGLSGIVRIVQVKRRHDLYRDPDETVIVDELHEHMPAWRRRLRAGVFGYVLLWVFAWVIGLARYHALYL